jgi:hypothetical protein
MGCRSHAVQCSRCALVAAEGEARATVDGGHRSLGLRSAFARAERSAAQAGWRCASLPRLQTQRGAPTLREHAAYPDHGCARQEFANLPNPKHISLDCHRGGVGCEGWPRPVAEVVTVVVRAFLAVETPRKRGGVFRTQRRAPRTHVCTTTARTPRAKERLA